MLFFNKDHLNAAGRTHGKVDVAMSSVGALFTWMCSATTECELDSEEYMGINRSCGEECNGNFQKQLRAESQKKKHLTGHRSITKASTW